MKKIVFCGVSWMKYYHGAASDDIPMNGGTYIEEEGKGGEEFNFAPYNHKCYGYVMHNGKLHIERFDKTLENHSETTDVTVVWVATNGNHCMIVGWYEHATMYRDWQTYGDPEFLGENFMGDYNFVADEKDCYLIDEEKRNFEIPRAAKAGKGRGMGQSQVWYADSEYLRKEFIPKVYEFAVHHQGITTAIKADAECGNGYTKGDKIEPDIGDMYLLAEFIEFANKRFHLAYETIFAKMSIGKFFEKCGKVLGNYDDKLIKRYLLEETE